MVGPAKQLFPMLSVERLERALEFYGRLLGGEQNFRFPPDGEPVFVTLKFGESELGLAQMGSKPPLHGQPLRPATGHRMELCVYVDDVDRTVERLRAANVRILLDPTDQPWGERVAYAADPDGNLVMLTR
jgi:lactoylglutathione lyase